MSTLRVSFFGLAIGLGLTIGGISIPAVHAGPSLMDKDPMTAAVSAVLAELDERSRASVAVQSGALMERVRP